MSFLKELKNQGSQAGVTLPELMVALAISMVTLAAIYTIHVMEVKNQLVQEDVVAMQQNARAAMDLISRELRMGGYDPRGVNRDAISSNDFIGVAYHPTQLHIQSDWNGNGTPTDPNESIVYLHDPKTLTLRRRTGRGGRQPVAEHIESFTFQYLDGQGQPTMSSASIRAIEIGITARTEHPDLRYPQNNGYRTFTLNTRVTPRNLS